VTEKTVQFRLDAPGGYITASYVGESPRDAEDERQHAANITDVLELHVSAPSSGHQLMSLSSAPSCMTCPPTKPRVSELLTLLKAKFKADPSGSPRTSTGFHVQRWPHPRAGQGRLSGLPSRDGGAVVINGARDQPHGRCDVVMEVDIGFGISQEHAKRVDFVLSDNERVKLNAGADYAFFESYVRDLQSRTKGNAPNCRLRRAGNAAPALLVQGRPRRSCFP